MSNLFDTSFNSADFSTVVSFLEKDHEEGQALVYKGDINRSLRKTIAAMANTIGGLIILGVEDHDNKPKPPFTGIDF